MFLFGGEDMANITYLYNGQIVLETGIIWDGAMVIADGKIQSVGKQRQLPCPEGAKKIDAEGAYIGPGFVDIHVHGGGGDQMHLDPLQCAEFFLSHGTTTILPTPAYDLPYDVFLEADNS